MFCPQIELWLYDTQQELDRDAGEGRVCPRSAFPALAMQYSAREIPLPPWELAARPAAPPDGEITVLAANSRAGLPTQTSRSLDSLLEAADPLLLAATWQDLPRLLDGMNDPRSSFWADKPLTLHYHGFAGPAAPRRLPLSPAEFPARPYPLLTMLENTLRSRRCPLPRQPRPFSLGEFWRDLCRGQTGDGMEWLESLRGWKLLSCLPDRGVAPGERLWDAPLNARYPRLWIIENPPAWERYAYTSFVSYKRPAWPVLLCHAIRSLPPGSRRVILAPESRSSLVLPGDAATGHCLGFVVDDTAHSITITRDDDARMEFCLALTAYTRDLRAAASFPF